MDQDVPQNPAAAATDGTPQPTNPAAAALQDEPTVSHKAYAQMQTRYNVLKKQYDELAVSFGTLNETHEQSEATAAARLQQLTEANVNTTTLKSDLTAAQQRLVKVDALTQLINDPASGLELTPAAQIELLKLVDKLPGAADVDAAKETIRQFAQFGMAVAQDRQQQANAGVTPGLGGTPPPAQPTTREGWLNHLDGKDPSDPAWEQYRQFSFKST
ncbi:hypothetical protein [Aggregatilinea lenta]|uniref:hypothetical protein n=1 Tax=Aggregatilinea lenta TaxID=913108 RepID=UPI000E5A1160|nr:hypothetical protein [Aggregatilinea lenta]